MIASVFADARTTDVRAACVGRATDFYARQRRGIHDTRRAVSLGVWVKSPSSHPWSSVIERAARAHRNRRARAHTVPLKKKNIPHARVTPAIALDARAVHAGPSRATRARPSRRHSRQGQPSSRRASHARRASYTYLGNLGGERRGGDDARGGGGDREGHRVERRCACRGVK